MKPSTTSNLKNHRFEQHPKTMLFIIILGGLFLILTVAEITARLFIPQWAPARAERVNFWQYDSVLGWAHRPHQTGALVHQDFAINVQMNADGLRDRDYSRSRTTKKRLLILGDSFGWGFGVEQPQIFSEILETHHVDWEVINASVSGYGTDQEYLYLQQRGIHYQPDIILLLFYENDFRNNQSNEEYWYYKPYFRLTADDQLQLHNNPVPTSSWQQILERWIYGHTYLWAKLYTAGKTIKHQLTASFNQSATAPTTTNDSKSQTTQVKMLSSQRQVTVKILSAIQQLAQHHQAQFILVSIPMSADQRAVLQQSARQEQFPYLTLETAWQNTPLENLTFPHDKHWNANGHEMAAHAIDEFLHTLKIW